MDNTRREKVEKAGFKVGSANDFLGVKDEWNCEEIRKAMQLAHEFKLYEGTGLREGKLHIPKENNKSPVYVYKDTDDAEFEIKYILACAQLGYDDPEITGYMKRRHRYLK